MIHLLQERALSHHRQGQLAQARALCQQILSVERRHFICLNLLGVIAGQQGHFRQAAEWFAKALAVEPQNADAHANRGLALQHAGDLDAALRSYERAIELQPECAESHSRRGVVLQAQGSPADALTSLDRALLIDPHFAEAYSNRGNVFQELGRVSEALANYDRAVALQPRFALAHSNRGNVLRVLHRPEEALASYALAIAADSDCAEAHANRGMLLLELNRPDEALTSLDRAIARRPNDAAGHLSRGKALIKLRRPEAALVSLDRALALRPDCAEAHCARGSALRQLNRYDGALAAHEKALAIKPEYAEASLNRGNIFLDLGRPVEAIANFDRAIQLQPDLAAAHFCRAVAWLQTGDYARGWAEYEWRWRSPDIIPVAAISRHWTQTPWRGEASLAGKSILLHAEQGLGDTIQFCRYATRVAQLGARVILEVQPPLLPLLGSLDGVCHLIESGARPPADIDYHCPLMSLPLALGSPPDVVPAARRYLHSDPGRVTEWEGRLAGVTGPRIGLAWCGNPIHANDRNRSIPLARLMAPLPRNLSCVSLHKDDGTASFAAGHTHPRVWQLAGATTDFADAAALCDSVDLVISIDTSLAHLSAALGRETWLLLPFSADWRWLLERDDSPWYPTVKLYRQPKPGDWDSVLQRVAADLSRRFS